MTATTDTRSRPTLAPPLSFRCAMRSEWTKLTSVRSTRRFVPIVLLSGFGLSMLAAVLTRSSFPTWETADQALFDPLNHSLISVAIAQFATAIVGVLAMTGEHGSGTLRTTLMGTPIRERVLAAKAAVVGVGALVVGVIITVPSFLISQAILSGHAPTIGLTHPGVIRGLLLSSGYLAAMALIGLSIGTLVRHSAGAIAGLVAFIFAVPSLVAVLPRSISDMVMQFLPMVIGSSSLSSITDEAHTLGPWSGSAVLLVYVALFGGLALRRFRHDDA